MRNIELQKTSRQGPQKISSIPTHLMKPILSFLPCIRLRRMTCNPRQDSWSHLPLLGQRRRNFPQYHRHLLLSRPELRFYLGLAYQIILSIVLLLRPMEEIWMGRVIRWVPSAVLSPTYHRIREETLTWNDSHLLSNHPFSVSQNATCKACAFHRPLFVNAINRRFSTWVHLN